MHSVFIISFVVLSFITGVNVIHLKIGFYGMICINNGVRTDHLQKSYA